MGIRFFKCWLLFWHPNFENLKCYKYFTITIFIIRSLFLLFIIIFWSIILEEETQKSSFEVAEDLEVSQIMTSVFIFTYFIFELLITTCFYLFSRLKKANKNNKV